MGKSTGQLQLQRWDQVDLSAQGKSPAPWLLLAISIRFFCACVLVSPLTLPTPPLPHGPLQVGVTPALSFERWIELKRVNWWGGFAGFLSPWLASFFSPLISLSHPSESTLLQLHLHCRSPPQGTTLLHLHLAAWSLQPPVQMLATKFVLGLVPPLHYPKPPLHIEILAMTYRCGWPPALGSTRSSCPSSLVTFPNKHLPAFPGAEGQCPTHCGTTAFTPLPPQSSS